MNPNFLFLNRGDGTFDDVSELSGAAYDIERPRRSRAWAWMPRTSTATACPSCSSPTSPTSTTRCTRTSARGSSTTTPPSSAWRPTRCRGSSWGCALADFDNDGWPDCFVVNGHVDNNRQAARPAGGLRRDPAPVPQHPAASGSGWRPGTPGPYFDTKHVGRGAAFGDIDNDGDIDIVVNHKDGAPAVAPQRHQVEEPLDPVRPPGDQEQPRRDRRQARGRPTRSEAGRAVPASGRSTASARAATACRDQRPAGPGRRRPGDGSRKSSSDGRRASSARSKTSRSTGNTRSSSPRTASPSRTGAETGEEHRTLEVTGARSTVPESAR